MIKFPRSFWVFSYETFSLTHQIEMARFLLQKSCQKAIVKFCHFLFLILFQRQPLVGSTRGWWKFTECNTFWHFGIVTWTKYSFLWNNLFSNTRLILAYLLSNFIFHTFTSCYEIYILEYFTWYLCTLESHFRRFTENEPWWSDCHPKILKYSKYGKINVLEIFRMWKCQNMEPWSDYPPKILCSRKLVDIGNIQNMERLTCWNY